MRNHLATKTLAGLLLTPLLVIAATDAPDVKFTFTSIGVVGTNLVLRAVIPAGLEQITLETRPDFDSRWQTADLLQFTNFGNEFEFTIPKPAGMQFMRLRAAVIPADANGVSIPLNYVTMPPLVLSPTNSAQLAEAVFHFCGRVDGSDKMLINREGVFWENVNWGWPEGAITINGVKWNPAEINYVTTAGPDKLLPRPLAFDSATLEIIKARDIVALEQRPDALIVYMNDTLSGADDYEFKIHFHPPKPPPVVKSTPATLKIIAAIDGSDCLTITTDEARWQHFHYQRPWNVSLNGVAWQPATNAILKNEPPGLFLPAGVDLSTAKITERKGRDLATMLAADKELKISFADNPHGADTYELTITFGQ